MLPAKHSLRELLVWPLAVIGIAAALLSHSIVQRSFEHSFEDACYRQAESLSRLLSFFLDAAHEEPEAMVRTVQSLAVDSDIEEAVIALNNEATLRISSHRAWLNIPIADLPNQKVARQLQKALESNRPLHDEDILAGQVAHYYFPIQVINKDNPGSLVRGVVGIGICTARIYAEHMAYRRQTTGLLLLLLLAITVVSYYLVHYYVITPLAAMHNAIEQKTVKSDAAPIPVLRDDEIGHVASSYNQLLAVLNRSLRQSKRDRDRLELAFEGTADGIWDWNVETNEVLYSARFQRLLGYEDNELEDTFEEFCLRLHPEDKEATLSAVNSHLTENTPYDVQYRLRTRSGTYRWYRAKGKAARDAAGNPVRMAGSLSDITEYKMLNERFSSVVEAAPYGIVLADATGEVILANPYARRLINLPKGSATVRNVRDLFLQPKSPAQLGALISTPPETTVNLDDAQVIVSSAESVPVDMQLTTIPFLEQSYVLITFVDITAKKAAAEKLDRLIASLTETNLELEQFAYIASHDLRSPLVNIKGFAGELDLACETIRPILDAALPDLTPDQRHVLKLALEEDIPEALNFIATSVERMDLYTQSLLKLSRMGRRDLVPKRLATHQLVKDITASYSHQISEKGITVHFDALEEVVGDELAVSQIFGNLIDNAIKYADPEAGCKLTITSWAEESFTYFRVSDTGPGIPEGVMDTLFAVFRRGNHKEIEGEGMGLAYVRTLVRKHGGSIACESELGKGTHFTFSIHRSLEEAAT